jgi:uncharacterized protein
MDVSAVEARRIALHAQGFGKPRPAPTPTMRHVRAAVAALGAVQIDAVNVLVRAQYLTLYSRLGPYPVGLLDDLVYKRRHAFEYWGHAASILPIELHPVMRWKMARLAQNKNWLAFQARLSKERPGYLEAVEREVTERGPITFSELTDPGRRERVPTKYADSSLLWYNWADGKSALEGLFNAGRLAAAGRKGSGRLFDLAERVIPAEVRALPTPSPEDAQRTLVRHAANALGVATARDLAYYFYLPAAVTKARIRELLDGGEIVPARVEGWADVAYMPASAKAGPVAARTLLSPFDSLLWERNRVERLFGFRHSFELYVKPAKREYGYYVLPFLLGDALVARVDLKADRARQTLLVLGAFGEPQVRLDDVAKPLTEELRTLADWLALEHVEVLASTDLGTLLRS